MKRKLALVLAAVLLLGTLSACGNDAGSGQSSNPGDSASPSDSSSANPSSNGSAETGLIIETHDKINSTYTNNTPGEALSETAVPDTLTIALAAPNGNLPALLDVRAFWQSPGSIWMTIPSGSTCGMMSTSTTVRK